MNNIIKPQLSPEELYLISLRLKMKFSIEEMYLISQCAAKERKEIIFELQNYSRTADKDMAEFIDGTIEKVKKLTYDELGVILNYPVEAD